MSNFFGGIDTTKKKKYVPPKKDKPQKSSNQKKAEDKAKVNVGFEPSNQKKQKIKLK